MLWIPKNRYEIKGCPIISSHIWHIDILKCVFSLSKYYLFKYVLYSVQLLYTVNISRSHKNEKLERINKFSCNLQFFAIQRTKFYLCFSCWFFTFWLMFWLSIIFQNIKSGSASSLSKKLPLINGCNIKVEFSKVTQNIVLVPMKVVFWCTFIINLCRQFFCIFRKKKAPDQNGPNINNSVCRRLCPRSCLHQLM